MGKNLKDMTRQEQAAYFKSKDYRGEQLKVVMDAISYGIGADYLQLFEDTAIPIGIMENMFVAMKEDYGVEAVMFLSTVHEEEAGRIVLEALRAGVSFQELKENYRDGMLPIELREKILPLMQGRAAVPEEIGERMEFITEAVKELRESFLRQDSFLEELKKAMKEKPDILSAQGKAAEADKDTDIVDDPCYLELEAQFRQAREDAGQIAEIRLGIGDGLNEEQLILLADKSMDADKIRELRMTMKILNERGQGS